LNRAGALSASVKVGSRTVRAYGRAGAIGGPGAGPKQPGSIAELGPTAKFGAIPKFGDRRRMRVGLLGGSFNPAHEGHRHVAELAMRRLRLDQVWLLVSPGNPLKPADGMASFADRLASAGRIADGRRVVASAVEAALRTRYTVDTMRLLLRRFPLVRFVWIMGADILGQLPKWRRWTDIVRRLAFAVLPRPNYSHRALAGQAAHRLRAERRPAREATLLPGAAPGWVFLPARQTAVSATAIRQSAVSASRSHRAAEGPVP
jgi:nicotinate-nucleotide adenylyltransferase